MVATVIAYVGTLSTAAIIQAALTIASISYQIVQAKKMKKAARDAAEARKGYEFPVEGAVQPVPIVYGRALVGGVRVYHNTSSNFTYVTPNSDFAYNLGEDNTGGGLYTYDGGIVSRALAASTGKLNQSLSGEKNEFLFYQQVLCQGPINAVHDFVVDESRYLDDISLSKDKAGLRIDLHYDGGVADSIFSANFPDRSQSKFPDLAYANVIIKLDRDNAQFNGSVPMVQFFIEGRKVKTVSNGVLSTNRVYSNNPAWCLLDYLLFDSSRYNSGKSLTVDQIDLNSFEQAALLCETIVDTNKITAGKIWRNTEGTRNIQTRNLPLYECNAIIDVTKPLRENVESLLSTMGDARLVWSQGKYKLLLQYPASNEDISLAAVLTDNDLILGESIDINWPDSSQRLNHCTIRFHNEAENFKEDTVSWPPKTSGTYFKGVGGKKYPIVTESWTKSETSIGGSFLNNYGVWNGSLSTTNMSWKLRIKNSGNYRLEYTADDSMTISIASQSFSDANNWKNLYTKVISLTANIEYTISIQATDNGGQKGTAARLVEISTGLTVWSTRFTSYDAYQEITQSSAIYDAMFAEDSNIELETDMFLDGCTDFYHALAKAEELVRTSRTAIGVSFSYNVKDLFLEPGDIIQLQSQFISLGQNTPLYLRINEVNMNDNGTCKITGTRFDYTQLAWNVADDEYIEPPNLYSFDVPAPFELRYVKNQDILYYSSGILEWDPVEYSNLAGYIIYINTYDDIDSNGNPVFREIGRSNLSPFVLPTLDVTSAIFGIRTLSTSGRTSALVITGTSAIEFDPEPYVLDLTPPPTATNFSVNVDKNIINISVDNATYTVGHGHDVSVVYGAKYTSGALPTFSNAIKLNEFTGNKYRFTSPQNTNWRLWLKWKTIDKVESLEPAGGVNGLEAIVVGIETEDLGINLSNQIVDINQAIIDLETIYGDTVSAAQSATDAIAAKTAALLAEEGAELAKDEAIVASTNASTAASNASTSATQASASATSAAGSASSASISATAAANSANSAGDSASAAATSASNANTYATDAETASAAAINSATNAATSAGSASTFATQASTSATNAAGSASSASTSATNAANSATSAGNSATAAAGSASTATTKATEASNSASAANTSRVAAESARDSAQGSASAAATSAQSASTSASNASQSAQSASQSATSASTSASNASTFASQSSQSATNAAGSASSAAESLSSVQAIADGYDTTINAAIQQRMIARASSTGAALAEYSIVVDTNGRISGFGLGANVDDATGAQNAVFAINADKFYIAAPGGGLSDSPFKVITTGPETGVFIKNASIENLSITNTKIDNSAVSTVKVANNAITSAVSAYTASAIEAISDITWIDAQSLTITTTGARVFISATANIITGIQNPTGDDPFVYYPQARLIRGSDILVEMGTVRGPFAISFSEFPASGTHTYKLQIRGENTSDSNPDYPEFSQRSIFAIETKK